MHRFGTPTRRWRQLLAAAVLIALATCALPTYQGALAARAWNAAPFELAALPAVLQEHANDCGPAVIATLLAAAGRPTPLALVGANALLGPTGASLGEFARLAHEFGLPGAWYHVAGPTLTSLPGPFVAHLSAEGAPESGHLVVVWRVGQGTAIVSDPASGAHALALTEFARRYTGRAYVLDGPT